MKNRHNPPQKNENQMIELGMKRARLERSRAFYNILNALTGKNRQQK